MIPLVTRTAEEMILLVPHELREAALALGVPRWRTTLSVVVRAADARYRDRASSSRSRGSRARPRRCCLRPSAIGSGRLPSPSRFRR